MKPRHLIATAFLTTLAFAPLTQAAIAVSNLGETSSGLAVISPFGGSSEGSALAQAFTTPSSGSWTLQSLTFYLNRTGTPPGSLTVALYTDSGGTPGTLVDTLSGVDPTTIGEYSYTPSTTITLNPSTTYFAVLTAPTSPGNFFSWGATTSTVETGDPGWSIADVSRQNPAGSLWINEAPLRMAVNVIPEPSAALLSLVALGSALLSRRRR